jgi:hypothetical protein
MPGRDDPGETQSLFRDLNERINARKQGRTVWVALSPWVCECANTNCAERITLSLDEYKKLRSEPTHFAVVAEESHVVFEAERVVEKRERYWVVEKIGEAAETSEALDVR